MFFCYDKDKGKKNTKEETKQQKTQVSDIKPVSNKAEIILGKSLSLNLDGDIRLRYEHINNASDLNNNSDDLDEHTMFRTRLLLSGDIVKGNDTSIKYNCVLQKYNRSWGQEGISSVGGMGGETLENAEKNIVINQAFLEIGNKGKLYLGRMPVGLDDLESLYDYDPEYNMVGEKNPVLFFVGDTVKWKPPNYNIFFFGSTLQEAGISAGNSDIRLWGGVYQSTSTIIHNIFFLALDTGKWGYTIGGKLGGNLETRFFPIKLNGIGVFQFGKDYSSIDLRGKAYLIEANLKVNKKVIEEFGVIYARGSADDPETPDTNEGFYDLNDKYMNIVYTISSAEMFRYIVYILAIYSQILRFVYYPEIFLVSVL